MQNKLTLRLDDNLIVQAKHYAAEQGRSLSDLVASYFLLLAPQSTGLKPSKTLSQNSTPQSPVRRSKFHGKLASLSKLPNDALKQIRTDYVLKKHA